MTSNISDDALLPCPFCGEPGLLQYILRPAGNLYWGECTGEEKCVALNAHFVREEAIAAWNTRLRIMPTEEMIPLADVLRLLEESAEDRWRPLGADPKYIDGYEVGFADACLFMAEDLRKGPPYPFKKSAMQSTLLKEG